jgi:hypothetical protein
VAGRSSRRTRPASANKRSSPQAGQPFHTQKRLPTPTTAKRPSDLDRGRTVGHGPDRRRVSSETGRDRNGGPHITTGGSKDFCIPTFLGPHRLSLELSCRPSHRRSRSRENLRPVRRLIGLTGGDRRHCPILRSVATADIIVIPVAVLAVCVAWASVRREPSRPSPAAR